MLCGGAAKACRGFLSFGYPVGAAKAFGGRGIPLGGFGVLPVGFKEAGQLESDHGVSSLLIQVRELRRGILAGACAANARGDLLPISHTSYMHCNSGTGAALAAN